MVIILKKLTVLMHDFLKDLIKKDMVCIDATCGNGHDTLFLSQHCKFVYAYDIQEQAIKNTKRRLLEFKKNNVEYLNKSHDTFNDIKTNVDIIVYNLGYLPRSDKTIKTTSKTTIESVKNGLIKLNKHGILALLIYRGHQEGKLEYNDLMNLFSTFSKNDYHIKVVNTYLDFEAPVLLLCQKL
jgi:tRNA1(Val) A37 N6-methylase TrmN6